MRHVEDIVIKQVGDRNATRKLVFEVFVEEEPGQGSGDLMSRYRYNVEKTADGKRVYLIRPANLKMGFDFVINLEGASFGKGRENPSHDDIFSDLAEKAKADPKAYARLHEALCRVHACEDPDDILSDYKDLKFKKGLSVEAILKIVKWFFIEQDIRYWNCSGRNMFKKGLDSVAASGKE